MIGIRRPVSGSSTSRADEVPVPLVVGVHRHRGVAEHRLGPGGRDHDRVVAVAVPDRDELALVVGVLDLDVRQRGQAARAPVDDPLGAVDQPVVEEPLEDRQHGPGQALVHREPLAGPVDRVAQAPHLAEDRAAGLGLPLPDPLDELLPAKVVPGQALGGELALDHVLGGDAGVVHAGQPQRLVALHPPAPDQGVLDRVVEGVADVQRAGHVRRRNDDAVRLAIAGRVRREVTGLYPQLVPPLLDLARACTGRAASRRHGSGRVSRSRGSLRTVGPPVSPAALPRLRHPSRDARHAIGSQILHSDGRSAVTLTSRHCRYVVAVLLGDADLVVVVACVAAYKRGPHPVGVALL